MKPQILVADDEPMLLQLARKVLERAGYAVVTAPNGAEALRLFEQSPHAFEAVILDLQMPLLGGLEAWQQMERLRPGLPVLFCTGDAEGEFGQRAGVGVLQKPFSLPRMLEALSSVLRPIAV
jgi:CheY-like chemotaxis protein